VIYYDIGRLYPELLKVVLEGLEARFSAPPGKEKSH